MTWLKNALVDIAVTIVIAIAVFSDAEWGFWIVVVYTPLMLALKLLAVSLGGSIAAFRRKQDDVPPLFLHVLYAVNTVLLLIHGWWITGGMWVAIWLLSFLHERRVPAAARAKK